MIQRLRNRRQQGFTLIELLIVVAIIGIIAALLIPNFLDSLQKAKQKRTMGDVRNVGTAWFSWLTDQYGGAAAAGQTTTSVYTAPTAYTTISDDLVPRYIQEIPENDSWGNEMEYCRAGDVVAAQEAMAIASGGRDGVVELGCGDDIVPLTYEPTDYDNDIVWADGFFIVYPNRADLTE